jgi:hypothetical protein
MTSRCATSSLKETRVETGCSAVRRSFSHIGMAEHHMDRPQAGAWRRPLRPCGWRTSAGVFGIQAQCLGLLTFGQLSRAPALIHV